MTVFFFFYSIINLGRISESYLTRICKKKKESPRACRHKALLFSNHMSTRLRSTVVLQIHFSVSPERNQTGFDFLEKTQRIQNAKL